MKYMVYLVGLLLLGMASYGVAAEKSAEEQQSGALLRPLALTRQKTYIEPDSSSLSPKSPVSPTFRDAQKCAEMMAKYNEQYNLDSRPPTIKALLALSEESTALQIKLRTIGEGRKRVVEKELEDCLKKLR